NVLLLFYKKKNKEGEGEVEPASVLYTLCDILVILKYSNFAQNECKENTFLDTNIYINSIILDINIIITILLKSTYNNTINENMITKNNRCLLNFLSKWKQPDICCSNYLSKIKAIITNLNELNYFKNKIDDVILYLKVFKKLLLFYDTRNRKELLEVIKFLIGIYIELIANRKSHGVERKDDNIVFWRKHTHYEKVLFVFDCMIYLENEEYLLTYEKIYDSKIMDVINYLTNLKNLNIFSEYILKFSTKICIIELIMLLNIPLISIPKSVIINFKNFLRSYTVERKINDKNDYYCHSEYYFFIINFLFKFSKSKLHMLEGKIGKKDLQKDTLLNNNFDDRNINKEEKLVELVKYNIAEEEEFSKCHNLKHFISF
ncbi:hypothetical protein PMLGA01_130010100, partial [Plasmodium malariae]